MRVLCLLRLTCPLAVRAEAVIEGIRFLTKFILNVDESFLP